MGVIVFGAWRCTGHIAKRHAHSCGFAATNRVQSDCVRQDVRRSPQRVTGSHSEIWSKPDFRVVIHGPSTAAMNLGNFSVSLSVKDLETSRAFYEALGFTTFGGDATQNWLILKNGDCVIGLFQGMFEKNMLTFNPGWDNNAQKLDSFTDVRELQRQLKAQRITLQMEADEAFEGPASFIVIDPDGNPILFDQHV